MKDLNVSELKSINGGLGPLLVFGLAAIGTYGLLSAMFSDDCADGVNDQNGVGCE